MAIVLCHPKQVPLDKNETQKNVPEPWILTDDDSFQLKRRIGNGLQNIFELYQVTQIVDEYHVSHDVLDFEKYVLSGEELNQLVGMYGYDDIDSFVVATAATNEFIRNTDGSIDRNKSPAWYIDYSLIAEMAFEIEAMDSTIGPAFSSFEEAVEMIQKITGYGVGNSGK